MSKLVPWDLQLGDWSPQYVADSLEVLVTLDFATVVGSVFSGQQALPFPTLLHPFCPS